MAKWFGVIGYATSVETKPGVWTEEIVERSYYGDLNSNARRLQTAEKLNDDINISNTISILSDPYTEANFHAMRYVTFMDTKWKISNADIQYPRIVLSVGGVYNGT